MSDDALQRSGKAFVGLVQIMRRLRGPDGCPWDLQQTMESLRRYTLEEAYEVVQAIDDGDRGSLRGELGDLLLQIVFLSQIAAEEGEFDVADVADGITDKLVRRHPHVFGDVEAADADAVVRNWERIKHQERGGGSLLDDVPRSLPALSRAQKLSKRAAQTGFDWSDSAAVLQKVREEIDELEQAMATPENAAHVEEELGDTLFALASLARHLQLSAEVCANGASDKFERRFRRVEEAVAAGRVKPSVEAMESEWERVKSLDRGDD